MGCLCSHMTLKARDCFQNNGGICLFCVQNKERQMRQRALQVRVDNDKEKAENRTRQFARGAVLVTNYQPCGYNGQEGLV